MSLPDTIIACLYWYFIFCTVILYLNFIWYKKKPFDAKISCLSILDQANCRTWAMPAHVLNLVLQWDWCFLHANTSSPLLWRHNANNATKAISSGVQCHWRRHNGQESGFAVKGIFGLGLARWDNLDSLANIYKWAATQWPSTKGSQSKKAKGEAIVTIRIWQAMSHKPNQSDGPHRSNNNNSSSVSSSSSNKNNNQNDNDNNRKTTKMAATTNTVLAMGFALRL